MNTAFIFIVTIGGFVTCSSLPDQCQNYKTFPRDKERLRTNAVKPTNPNIPCDTFPDGWYRFGTGEIATTCVPQGHCGTTTTVWMKDSIPLLGLTSFNEFCVSHQTTSGQTNPCCLYSFHQNVTNCNGFLVYQTQAANILCPSGYCSEILQTCPAGRTSPTGFEPCSHTDPYPMMSSPPKLGNPVLSSNGKDFTHTCQINYNGSDSSAAFLVKWLFDGKVYKTVDLTRGDKTASLSSADWKNHLGQKLSCSVSSYYPPSGTGVTANYSTPLDSNEYFGGLKLDAGSVVVYEGFPRNVTILSTLPVVCPNTSSAYCRWRFDLVILSGPAENLFSNDNCEVSITTSEWNQISGTAEVTTQLSTMIDPVDKPDRYLNVAFRMKNNSDVLWNYRQDLEMTVTARDLPHHACMAMGSSHIVDTTPNKAYEVRTLGAYLFYKNTNTTGQSLEVQIMRWQLLGPRAATCGVVFLYGGTFIKIDMCSSQFNMTAPIVTQGEKYPDDVHVYECNSNYEIVTGDGVRLTVVTYLEYMDVKLHLSSAYVHDSHAHDLCGSVGHNHVFPFLTPIPTEKSLFGGKEREYFQVQNTYQPPEKRFCMCGKSAPICKPFMRVSDPQLLHFVQSYDKFTPRPHCRLVKPHGVDPDYGDNLPPFPAPSKTTSRIDHNTIKTQCENEIRAKATTYCAEHFGYRLSEFVNMCFLDAYATNSYGFLPSAVLAFEWWCEAQVLHHYKNYRTNSVGIMMPPVEITTDVCPNSCSDKGVCNQGTCTCNATYTGSDCSVSLTDAPAILGIKGGYLCQISSGHCTDPILVTRNVYSSPDLQAELTPIEFISGKEHYVNSTKLRMEPVYENRYSLYLPISNAVSKLKDPTLFGFSIRISSDGKTFSNPFEYIVYDDNCHVCLGKGCFEREDTCRIDGRCYLTNDVNPKNSSQICDPDKKILHWSEVTQTGSPSSGVTNSRIMVGR